MLAALLIAFQGVDAAGVAPIALVVHATAEQKAIRRFNTGEIGVHIRSGFSIMNLMHQNGGQDFRCAGIANVL